MAKKNWLEKILAKVKKHPVYTALATLISILILVGTFVKSLSIIKNFIFPPHKPSRTNIELVLDASAKMLESFENQTRLDIARKELKDILEHKVAKDNVLGLLTFGHRFNENDNRACTDTEHLVELDTKNVEDIRKALEDLKSKGGKSLLGKAIIEAMAKFDNVDRFPPEKSKLTVIVLTSGIDNCNENFLQDVREAKERYYSKLNLDFKIIGLGVKVKDAKGIDELASVLNGKAYYVTKSDELNQLTEIFLVKEPFINNNRELVNALHNMTNSLNKVIQDLNNNQPQNAEKEIAWSEEIFSETKSYFHELKGRKYNEISEKIIELIKQMREEQANALSLVKEMTTLSPTGNSQELEQYNQLINSYNQVRSEYNSRLIKMEDLVNEL